MDHNKKEDLVSSTSTTDNVVYLRPAKYRKDLVLVPARNEENTVGEVVDSILADNRYEVIVIDDASSDKTAENARQAGARVIHLPFRLGAWGAIQTGMGIALAEGYETAITMDADGQHLASELGRLTETMLKVDADVLIGKCSSRASWYKLMAWQFFGMLTGLNFTDLTSGFRIYNQSAMKLLTTLDATMLDYQDLGVLLILSSQNRIVSEVNVDMSIRSQGKSKIFGSCLKILNYLFHSTILGICKR